MMDVVVPRPHVEIASLERSLLALRWEFEYEFFKNPQNFKTSIFQNFRQENANLKKDLQSKQGAIAGMKKDLSGAAARLSDVRSEIDNSQKQAMLNAERRWKETEQQLLEARNQLEKLSDIVEVQRGTIAQKEKEIEWASF